MFFQDKNLESQADDSPWKIISSWSFYVISGVFEIVITKEVIYI